MPFGTPPLGLPYFNPQGSALGPSPLDQNRADKRLIGGETAGSGFDSHTTWGLQNFGGTPFPSSRNGLSMSSMVRI
jgi:hypothetical protein